MNVDYLDQAKEQIANVPLLINIISRRVRQLNAGQRPLVKPDNPSQPNLDIALKEVAEGKLESTPLDVVEEPTEESILSI